MPAPRRLLPFYPRTRRLLPARIRALPLKLAQVKVNASESHPKVRTLEVRLRQNNLKPLPEQFPFLPGDEVIVVKGQRSEVGKRGKIVTITDLHTAAIVEGVGYRPISGRVIQVPLPLDQLKLVNPQTNLPTSPVKRWVHYDDGTIREERVTRRGIILPHPPDPPVPNADDHTKNTPYIAIQNLPSADAVQAEEIAAQAQRKVEWLLHRYHLEVDDHEQSAVEEVRQRMEVRKEFQFRVYLRALEILRERKYQQQQQQQEQEQEQDEEDQRGSLAPPIPLPPPSPFRLNHAMNDRPDFPSTFPNKQK